jgi:hypothetical protein
MLLRDSAVAKTRAALDEEPLMRCSFPACPFVGTPAKVAEHEDYMIGFSDFEHDSRLRGMPYTDPGMDAEQTVRSLLAKRARGAKLAREARVGKKRGGTKTAS